MGLKVGLQMFSLRDCIAVDEVDTIKKAGSIGFHYLEFANRDISKDLGTGQGTPVEKLKETFLQSGTRMLGIHAVTTEEILPDFLEVQRELGNSCITLPRMSFQNAEDVKRQAEYLNRTGKICKENGFDFCYHNHTELGNIFDGKLVGELLAEYTDPAYVGFELDTYWLTRSGLDPIEWIRKLGKRVKLIHQKDIPEKLERPLNIYDEQDPGKAVAFETLLSYMSPEAFAEIGTGIMDIQKIIDTVNTYTDAQYLILEQDMCKLDIMDSVRISLDNMKKYSGLSLELEG